MTSTPSSTFIAVPEACERLCCSRAHLYRLLGMGRLRARKLGRRTLVEVASVDELLDVAPVAVIRPPAARPAPAPEAAPAEAAA
jgi:excisionase family DNA binding protein